MVTFKFSEIIKQKKKHWKTADHCSNGIPWQRYSYIHVSFWMGLTSDQSTVLLASFGSSGPHNLPTRNHWDSGSLLPRVRQEIMPHENEWHFKLSCFQPHSRRCSNLTNLWQDDPTFLESIESIWIWMSLRMTVRVVQVPKEPREPYRMRRGNLGNGFEAFNQYGKVSKPTQTNPWTLSQENSAEF